MSKSSISDTHEWRRIENFVEGDYIRGLGQDMLVTRIAMQDKIVMLFYMKDNKEKYIKDAIGAEYIARKRGEP